MSHCKPLLKAVAAIVSAIAIICGIVSPAGAAVKDISEWQPTTGAPQGFYPDSGGSAKAVGTLVKISDTQMASGSQGTFGMCIDAQTLAPEETKDTAGQYTAPKKLTQSVPASVEEFNQNGVQPKDIDPTLLNSAIYVAKLAITAYKEGNAEDFANYSVALQVLLNSNRGWIGTSGKGFFNQLGDSTKIGLRSSSLTLEMFNEYTGYVVEPSDPAKPNMLLKYSPLADHSIPQAGADEYLTVIEPQDYQKHFIVDSTTNKGIYAPYVAPQRVIPIDQPGLDFENMDTPEEPALNDFVPGLVTSVEPKSAVLSSGMQVTDTVSFEGLASKTEYTVKATLVDKADKSKVLGESDAVVFTTGEATESDGSVKGTQTVQVTVAASAEQLAGVEAAVVFEKLTSTVVDAKGNALPEEKETLIVSHEDIGDAAQTVANEKASEETPTSEEPTSEEPTESEERSTSEPPTSEAPVVEPTEPTSSEPVPSTSEPEPSTSESSEPVESTVEPTVEPSTSEPTSEPSSSESVEPTAEPTTSEVPSEEPSTSESPTSEATSTPPSETAAPVLNDFVPGLVTSVEPKSAVLMSGMAVTDTVSFEGLAPKTEYTVKATLVDKADKSKVLGSSKSVTFTTGAATESDGSVKGTQAVQVMVTASEEQLAGVEAAVVFEKLTSTVVDAKGNALPEEKETLIVSHEDIGDAAQTVVNEKASEETPTSEAPVVEPTEPPSSEPVPSTSEAEPTTSKVTTPEQTTTQTSTPAESVQSSSSVRPTPEASSSTSSTVAPPKPDQTTQVTSATEPSSSVQPSQSVEPEPNDFTPELNGSVEPKSAVLANGLMVRDSVELEGLAPNSEYTLVATAVDRDNPDTVLGESEPVVVKTGAATEPDGSVTVSRTVPVPLSASNEELDGVDALVVLEKLTSTVVDAKGNPNPNPDGTLIAQSTQSNAGERTVLNEKEPEETPAVSSSETPPPSTAVPSEVESTTQQSSTPTSSAPTPGSSSSTSPDATPSDAASSEVETSTSETTTSQVSSVDTTSSESSSTTTSATESSEPEQSEPEATSEAGETTEPVDTTEPGGVTPSAEPVRDDGTVTLKGSLEPKSVTLTQGAVLTDTVQMEGLVPNTEYTLTATLVDRDNPEVVLGVGEPVTFTSPQSTTGIHLFASGATLRESTRSQGSVSDEQQVKITLTADDELLKNVKAAVALEKLTSTVVDATGNPGENPEGNLVAESGVPNAQERTVANLSEEEKQEAESPAGSSEPQSASGTQSATGTSEASSSTAANPAKSDSQSKTGSETVTNTATVLTDAASPSAAGSVPSFVPTDAPEASGNADAPRVTAESTQSAGAVTSEVKYQNLQPDTEYVLTSQVLDKKTGQPTGVANAVTFRTPTASTPTVSGTARIAVPASQTGQTQQVRTTISTPKVDADGSIVGVETPVASTVSTSKTVSGASAASTTKAASTKVATTVSSPAKSVASPTSAKNTAKNTATSGTPTTRMVVQTTGAARSADAQRVAISNVPAGPVVLGEQMPQVIG